MRTFFIGLCMAMVLLVQAQERVPGDIIVMMKAGQDMKAAVQQVEGESPLSIVHCISADMNIWLLHTNPTDEDHYLRALNKLPQTQFVQYNHIAQPRTLPNDSLFSSQWGLYNFGQNSGIPDADIDADSAWNITTNITTVQGDTIVVAIIDVGFDLNHIDINYWRNNAEIPGDSIDNDGNGYIDDVRGWYVPTQNDYIPSVLHGTHIAGIIGARGNNTIGVAGVHWGVKIMPVGVSSYNEGQVVEAYAYVIKQRKLYNQTNGAQGTFVVATNSSFGIDHGLPADYPLWCAMYDSLGKQGIVNAAATANIGDDIDLVSDIPTACPSDHIIAVTATTRTDYHNPQTAYGLTTIDLGAPGTGIMSTYPGNYYGYLNGTSMAAPFVAGGASFLCAVACDSFISSYKQYPDSFALVIKDLLLRGTDTIPTLIGKCVSSGRMNLYHSALLLLNDYCITCVTIGTAKQDVACFGDSTGEIDLTMFGTGPFGFNWSTGDTVQNLAGLPTGTYTVTVTDSIGCTRSATVSLTQPDPILTSYVVNRSLDSQPSGSIQLVNIFGGVTPYQYNWSNGDTLNTTDSLLPGDYILTITDRNGCQRIDTITVYNDTSSFAANTLQLENLQLRLYPNPVGDKPVTISWTAEPKVQTITFSLFDLAGRQLSSQTVAASQQNMQLDLQQQPPGLYFVRILANNQYIQTFKLLRY